MKNRVLYPVIAKEYNDDGHYYIVTSPNVQGMVVEGDTLEDAIEEASYDIADWFEVKGKIDDVVDSSDWNLDKDEKLVYVPVSLTNFTKNMEKPFERILVFQNIWLIGQKKTRFMFQEWPQML